MSMNPGKVASVGLLFLGALAADYIRNKTEGSYDFPEDNKQKNNSENKASHESGSDTQTD